MKVFSWILCLFLASLLLQPAASQPPGAFEGIRHQLTLSKMKKIAVSLVKPMGKVRERVSSAVEKVKSRLLHRDMDQTK